MALVINTNVASLNAQRNLGQSQSALGKSMQRLSSGLRINSAKDDAAGLAITDRMTSQVSGLNQAVRNANDGISMAQTAEGALGESTSILQRMRELAVQASNGTNTSADRASLDQEVQQLTSEVNRIAGVTSFNGQNLLDGTFASTGVVFQVGANAGGQNLITFTIGAADASGLGLAGGASVNTTAAVSYNAVVSAGTGTISTSAATSNVVTITSATGGANVLTFSAAQAAIATIDTAISSIDTIRGGLGAVQNRFESTISNLQNVAENLTSARSRILDADIAQETSAMTKNNILQQAGVSILAQANQTPQLALSLLG
jgi:flagellin